MGSLVVEKMRYIRIFMLFLATVLILFSSPAIGGEQVSVVGINPGDLINPALSSKASGDGNLDSAGLSASPAPQIGMPDTRSDSEALLPESGKGEGVLISNSSLQVDFSGAPTTGRAPLLVLFSDLTKGNPTSWVWDFGDGSTGRGEDILHEYWKGGIYTVQLTASNQDGDSGTRVKEQYITVRPLPVDANFTATPLLGRAPLTVKFTDRSTGAMIWSWDFGDGSPGSMIPNPDHTFINPGMYHVRLSVANEIGESATASQDINVTASDALRAEFEGTPTSGSVPLLVLFTDHSTGEPTSWIWNFGDGVRDTSSNPTHTYSAAGVYSVSLTVSDQDGNSDIAEKTDYINTRDVPPPSDSLPVSAGWNFVSVPKKLASGSDTAAIFGHIDADGHSILQYDSFSGQWVTMTRNSQVKPLDAIWLYSKKSDTVPLTYDPVSGPLSCDLSKGWNAVGFTGFEPETAKATLTSVQNTWLSCIEYNQELRKYDVMIIKGENDDTNLHPYHGFWLYMSGDGVITRISA